MIQQIHRGVGAIIRSDNAEWFFVQQKDETYPILKWRGAYSVWGGAMEAEDASPKEALFRELSEEFSLELKGTVHEIGCFDIRSDQVFPLTLFEIIVKEKDLFTFVKESEVLEGYGQLIRKNKLFKRSWVWDLDQLVKLYLSEKKIESE